MVTAAGLFDAPRKRKPRWRGSTALVPVGPRDDERAGATGAVVVEEPVLFRHGGHGATRRTEVERCSPCRYRVVRNITEVRPR